MTIIVLLGIVKGLSLIPVRSVHPFLADVLVRVQMVEIVIETRLAAAGDVFSAALTRRTIERSEQALRKQTETVQMLNAAIVAENNLLRSKLGFRSTYARTLISAQVIGRSVDNWFHFITVDKGSDDGVRPEMVVVNESGLVGYAAEVNPKSTRIILIIDPQVLISVMNERSKEIYVLKGAVLRPLDVKYATIHSDCQAGDVLVTSGYSYRYKRGIPVGVVTGVVLPKNKLFKRVDVKPVVDFSRLDVVFFSL